MPTQLFSQFYSLLTQVNQHNEEQYVVTYNLLVNPLLYSVSANINFHAHRFDQMMNMFSQLFHNYEQQGTNISTCTKIFECFIIMIEKRPILITKNKNRLLNLVEKFFQLFNMIDIQSTQTWMHPPEGFNQQLDLSLQQELTRNMMGFFDRLANAYQYNKFIDFFNETLPGWIINSQNNWKIQYTLLMSLSQLSQNIQYPLLIQPFVNYGIQLSYHPHPKIRYAVMHMFGLFSDCIKPDFQKIYGQQVLPIMINLANDQVPKVQTHTMACLNNFLQDFQADCDHILAPFADQIIQICRNLSLNGYSQLKQGTMNCLSSLLTVNLLTSEQVDRIFSIINDCLTNENHKKFQYNALMNQTIECLSIALSNQNKKKAQKYLTQSINVLKQLKDRLQKHYFVYAWSRFCRKYEQFTDLSEIFPHILQLISQMIQNQEQYIKQALQSIINTINSFKSSIKPFAKGIIDFSKNGINKIQKGRLERKKIYEILNNLLQVLNFQAPDPQWMQTSKQIFNFLYNEAQKSLNEQNSSYKEFQNALKGLVDIIKNMNNLFSSQDIFIFSQKMLNFSTKITSLVQFSRQKIQNYKNQLQDIQDDLDKQDINQLISQQQQIKKKLHTCRCIIPDIFWSLLSVIPQKQKKIQLTTQLFPHVQLQFTNNKQLQNVRYGLFFLCDFIDQLGYQGIYSNSQFYEDKFSYFASSPNIAVRNCAVYGLGIYMKTIPIEKTDQTMIYKWLNLLWDSLNTSINATEKKSSFQFAKDNIVSALGKLISSKQSYYPNALNQQVIKKWFENLPLNKDKVQGNIQHQILLKRLNQSPESLISSKQDVLGILNVFGSYFLKRQDKKQDLVIKNRKQTKQILLKIKNWPIFQQNSDYLWNQLPINHKNILTNLVSQ